MTSSGTYSFALSNADVMIEGFARCGVRRTAAQWLSFRDTVSVRDNEKEASCIVYAAVNTINGKIYIGATEKGLAARARKHFANAKRGQSGKFYTAIRSYGAELFEFVVLATCSDFWSALEIERQMIARLKPEYNLTDGGGGIKGFKFSAQSRAKMSEAKKGKRCGWLHGPDVDNIKKKLSDSAKRRKGTYRLTEANKESLRANARKANVARRKPIKCETDGNVFESAALAARHYGLTSGMVSYIAKGLHASRRGLIFSYLPKAA